MNESKPGYRGNKKKYSIFLKLALVITIAGIFIGCAFIIFLRFHFSSKVNTQFSKSVENYYRYIAEDIGSPPDTLLAKTIADKYFIAMKYVEHPDSVGESENYSWHYGNIDYELSSEVRHFLKFIVGFWRDDPLIIYNADGSRFIFSSDFHRIINPNPMELFIFLSAVIIILGISYAAIRNILTPVKQLSIGVEEVAKGNLEYKVPVMKNDELTLLSSSFNEMTKRIKEMIEARDQLLLDVSHELRSPITRIKVALQLLEDNPSLLEENKESRSLRRSRLREISSDIKELETMITELLESERLKDEYGKLKLVSYNFKELLNEILVSYDNPIIFIQNIPDNLYFSVDTERIRLVLKNIIDNSIKFSNSIQGQSNLIYISAEETNNKVIMKIRDEGIGIPEEDLPYIFEPFYRVDKSRTRKSGGYGLGLSLCKKIIEAHNGKISIANNDDRGITATIELPK